ncbi:thioredoxin-like protein [Rhodotorula diobovata]|uniref:Thioredoxin-like protein n=1 Tax=Rhodotorula diobovata TaxID=5288 RepID=A0A5C5G1Z0_9BASI|nr:thioredoxin-like protein [Rhodotorula diobovata]
MSAQPSSSSVHHKPTCDEPHSDDSDALLEELEEGLDNNFDLGGFREQRMRELQAQVAAAQQRRDTSYGRYTEIRVEKDLIQTTANAKRCVLHFFHRDFRRCRIMDSHLEKLAAKHTDVLFLKADVANVPFLVTKLEVKVLPCLIGFVDGVTKMKLVGFEELPGGDTFETAALEIGMVQCGVLNKVPGADAVGAFPSLSGGESRARGIRNGTAGGRGRARDDESDLDDD